MLICDQSKLAYLHADIASLAQGKLGTLQVDAHVQHGRQEALVDLPLHPPALAGCACGLHLHHSTELVVAVGSEDPGTSIEYDVVLLALLSSWCL